MENKNEENFFSFIPENSIISYKKYKFDFTNLKVKEDEKKSAVYSYDIYSNQYIYLFKKHIYIFNSKLKYVKKINLPKINKIKFCTCDKGNNYIMCISEKNMVYIINSKQGHHIKYDPYQLKTEVKLGYIYGGFFIRIEPQDKKKEEEIDIGLIGNNSYRILTIINSGSSFTIKNTIASTKIPITEYFYNNIFNVLIIRKELLGFSVINLKNRLCYNSCIEFSIDNIYLTSKFFLQNIYNKLYLIHFRENLDLIEFYRLKNLKEIKKPKCIKFNKSGKMIDYELVQFQFYNNLIILYLGDNIRLYDIKSEFNQKIGLIKIPGDKIDGFFDKIKINGKFVKINDEIYKIKFWPEIYKKNNSSNLFQTFFNLLRRKSTTHIVTSILLNFLREYELSTFYAIFKKLVENYVKSKNSNKIDDKKNANEIMYRGHNSFYLLQDHIFQLFNNEFENINNIKLLQVLATVYNEYEKNNIEIDKDVYIPVLCNNLNKTDDFSCLDFIIKNKNILLDKMIGLYLIDRSKSINEERYKVLAFNLGIEILMKDEDNIEDILVELNEEKKYEENVNLIMDFYIGSRFYKKDKNLKGDINSHITKFVTTQLTSKNKNGRTISMANSEFVF